MPHLNHNGSREPDRIKEENLGQAKLVNLNLIKKPKWVKVLEKGITQEVARDRGKN